MAPDLHSRIEHEGLRRKIVPAEFAVTHVHDRDVVACSGFTGAGEPKVFLPALAEHFAEHGATNRITLYSGASLSDATEAPLAPFIERRGPYMSCGATRKLINEGKIDFTDAHLSQFARNLYHGFYGDIDVAVVEVSRIRSDGSVIVTSSVGASPEMLVRARRVVLEVNVATPDYTGFHDIVLPPMPPDVGWPVPITNVHDRVGAPYAKVDPERVVAVVESDRPDHPAHFKPTTSVHRAIAGNVVDFLIRCRDWLGWRRWIPPLQSGVGNVANAIIAELRDSPFRRMRFWTEVFQDGMLNYVEDDDKFMGASATGLSFSKNGAKTFARTFERCRQKLVLRPMWLSNGAEVISRLFVVAMNTPLEVDIYGHVNSTHIRGSRLVNGLGGSGDFFRNAYLSIVHTPSIRRLSDGSVVSCVMPYLEHVDHTEHDIKCIVTEQGTAVTSSIRSGRHRAREIIDNCAHPHFRPLLRDYLAFPGSGDESHTTKLSLLKGWWREYEAACAELAE